MLRRDDRKQRLLQRIGLSLQRSKPITKQIEILRRESYETFFRQLGAERFVVCEAGLADRILRAALQAMLTNHNRASFAGRDTCWYGKQSACDDVRKNVQHNLVSSPL